MNLTIATLEAAMAKLPTTRMVQGITVRPDRAEALRAKMPEQAWAIDAVPHQRTEVIFWYDREACLRYRRGELQLATCSRCGAEAGGDCEPICPKPASPDRCIEEDDE